MKKNKSFNDIYKSIQNATDIPLPEALAPEAIVKTLENVQMQPKKRHIARYASLAAALAIVTLAGVVGFRLTNASHIGSVVSAPKIPQEVQLVAETEDEYLRTASYAEIEQFFLDKQKTYKTKSYYDDMNIFGFKSAETEEINAEFAGSASGNVNTDAANTTSGSSPSASSARTHGETNTQVNGIAEADILKNDGDYLYIVGTQQSTVDIVDIRDPQNMRIVSQIDRAAEKDGRRARELYVYDDTMVVLYSAYATAQNRTMKLYDACYAYAAEDMQTAVEVYDISDRTAPRLRFDYAVDGEMLSSRMDGSALLLVTTYNVPIYKDENDMKNACVPCTYQAGEKVRFPEENVRIASNTDSTAYLTVSLLDTQADTAAPTTKAILGGGNEIYCDGEALLVAQTDRTEQKNAETVSVSELFTRLYAFDIRVGIAYKGSVQIAGTTLNQFSMDSFGGYYRIATTASDGSCITVLNKSLETVSALSGIAKGESIYAARFMGNTAYLVTFYQTDPLFVVDLSDPAAPKVTGELKIPGFSNYLHPYADNLLIGIGQDGTNAGANNRLKISLFDVSDMQNPQEISKAVYNGGTSSMSAAQNTHKAFLSVPESGEFAIPVYEVSNDYRTYTYYASMLTVQNGKLHITGTYLPTAGNSEIERVTYADSTVFTLSHNTLTAFHKETGAILSEISYNHAGEVVIE